jgi:hypothetical protein
MIERPSAASACTTEGVVAMMIFHPANEDDDRVELVREIVKALREALKRPSADTFPGRKTQELFRKEEE